MKTEITIPGKVYGKERPRFYNNRAYTPKKTREYEELIAWTFKTTALHWTANHGQRVSIDITAYIWQKKEGPLNKKPDIDNIAKIALDALSLVAYKDDAAVLKLHVEKERCTRDEERLRIIVQTY